MEIIRFNSMVKNRTTFHYVVITHVSGVSSMNDFALISQHTRFTNINFISFDFRVSAHCYISRVTAVRFESENRTRICAFLQCTSSKLPRSLKRTGAIREVNVKHL